MQIYLQIILLYTYKNIQRESMVNLYSVNISFSWESFLKSSLLSQFQLPQ